MRICLPRQALVLALLGVLFTAPVAGQQAPIDWVALVGDYPRAGSEGQVGDTAILLWLQRTRTPEDILRAEGEVFPGPGLFSGVVGADLDSRRFPLTRALLAAVAGDLRGPMGITKQHFARPRPYAEDLRIKPAVALDTSYAYPSGHSGWGMVTAAVLADLVPARREGILARGRQVGYDRVLAGVHHPSDVVAGQRLGEVMAAAWLASPDRRRQVEAARAAEWVNPSAASH